MSTKQAFILISILVVILIITILLFPNTRVGTDNTSEFKPDEVLAAHEYSGSSHVFAGTVEMPTPCHILLLHGVIRESFPEQIVLQFKVENDDEICAQVITPRNFRLEVPASETASVEATWNGDPIRLVIDEDLSFPSPLSEDDENSINANNDSDSVPPKLIEY